MHVFFVWWEGRGRRRWSLHFSFVPTSFYFILSYFYYIFFFFFFFVPPLSFLPFFLSFHFIHFIHFFLSSFIPFVLTEGLTRRNLKAPNITINDYFFVFAGDHHPHVELAEWFIKQEEEYGIPQSFFQVVAADYESATLNKEHRKRTPKNNATVICEECGKSFSRLDSLRRHEKQYCRIKGERVFCRFCGKKFVRSMSLLAHMQSAHAAKLPESDSLGPLWSMIMRMDPFVCFFFCL